MASSTPHSLNLFGVLSESKRIINAHSRHFLALSVLFLLPVAFSLIIYPTLRTTITHPNSIFHHPHHAALLYTTPHRQVSFAPCRWWCSDLLIPLIFAVFLAFLSVCAVGTITYSTIHGFYGRPVKLVSSLKSLLRNSHRLVGTFLLCEVTLVLFCYLVLAVGNLACQGIEELFGLHINPDSVYVKWGGILVGCALGAFVIWLQLNWGLGLVVAVKESKGGYEALKRSAYLIKGMRLVAFSMMLLFGLLIWFFTWACSVSVADLNGISGWKSWAFIFQTVLSSGFVTLLMLHNVAANAVLYMYCKALHGELALEIAEEFAHEYVSLPFDDGKVPHVVSVVHG